MKFITVIGWLFGALASVSDLEFCELKDTSKKVQTIVKCDPQEKFVKVRICYCLTEDLAGNEVVGSCLYSCQTNIFEAIRRTHMYYYLNVNSTNALNADSCGQYKRMGLMCGECQQGFGYPAYSYSLNCVPCKNYYHNWLKYIGAVYLPLTLFCAVIVVFRISANSGWLIGYVILSQLSSPYNLVQLYLVLNPKGLYYAKWMKFLSFFYSFWNMNLFRSLYHPFCLHPQMSLLMIHSLDYVVAIYPLVAIFLTYLVVQQYYYLNFIARPCFKCFHMFKTRMSIKSSLIESFATLFLISYVKIMDVSSNILLYTVLYNSNGSIYSINVYNSPNLKYMSKEHRPYFVLAFVMSFTFNVFPLIFIGCYTFRCFQKGLNHLGLRCSALTIFMDAIQGSYKHSHYFRCFPVIFLLVLFFNFIILSAMEIEQYHPAASFNLLWVIVLLMVFKPFKNPWHNHITVFLFGVVFVSYVAVAFHIYESTTVDTFRMWAYLLSGISYCGSFVLPSYVFVVMVVKWKKNFIGIITWLMRKRNRSCHISSEENHLPQLCSPLDENSSLIQR